MENKVKILEEICRIFYCVALADKKLLPSEFSKLDEQMESLVNNSFPELDYDEKVLSRVINDVNKKAKIISPNGNIEDVVGHFLVAISESLTDKRLRETIINQCFSVALSDSDFANEESHFIQQLAKLWDLEDLYISSGILARSIEK
tara:strand:- start:3802 stop:4242 length:441 start_codon:yes stop_codon:yes gene_type:complete